MRLGDPITNPVDLPIDCPWPSVLALPPAVSILDTEIIIHQLIELSLIASL